MISGYKFTDGEMKDLWLKEIAELKQRIENLEHDYSSEVQAKELAIERVQRLEKALKVYSECCDGCTCGNGWSHIPAQEALE